MVMYAVRYSRYTQNCPISHLEMLGSYCRFIKIVLTIQEQNQERSVRLISNMCFLASCAQQPVVQYFDTGYGKCSVKINVEKWENWFLVWPTTTLLPQQNRLCPFWNDRVEVVPVTECYVLLYPGSEHKAIRHQEIRCCHGYTQNCPISYLEILGTYPIAGTVHIHDL